MIDKFLNFLFPPLCAGCETQGEYLCATCKKNLKPHLEMCPICHTGSPDYKLCLGCKTEDPDYPLQGTLIGFEYVETIKKLILALKFGHRSHVAKFLAERLSLIVQSHPELSKAIKKQTLVLTYVPSHWIRKYWIKGYNQSELLAKELGAILDLPVIGLTRRVKYTRSQVSLSRSRRLQNLIGAFGNNEEDILQGNETILIVDDITTTGSTLVHVAKQIRSVYPKVKIWGGVAGRSMK